METIETAIKIECINQLHWQSISFVFFRKTLSTNIETHTHRIMGLSITRVYLCSCNVSHSINPMCVWTNSIVKIFFINILSKCMLLVETKAYTFRITQTEGKPFYFHDLSD